MKKFMLITTTFMVSTSCAKTFVQEVKQELINKENISVVEIEIPEERELSIEVSETNLRKYKLTLQDIADKISQYSVEKGAGTLYTKNKEILLKIDQRKEILQPFYRLDESRSSVGFGLGLSLVNSIVQAHGGDIKIFHNKDKGTIVQLRFSLNREV